MTYFYKRTEPQCYTVGIEDSNGKWHPDSDWSTRDEAARQVSLLNGSNFDLIEKLESYIINLEVKVENLEKKLSALTSTINSLDNAI